MNTPLIGITVDIEYVNTYATVPWYALRKNYADAVHLAGGIPILIPHNHVHKQKYVDIVEGIILSGGHFDIPPHLYGEGEAHPTVQTKSDRTEAEWKLAVACLDAHKPILGICGGMQLLNVILGGTLIQDIETCHVGGKDHLQSPPYHLPHHEIIIKKDSILSKGLQTHAHDKGLQIEPVHVNSSHHQAVGKLAPGFFATAISPDGIVEAMESETAYIHGVQWHPEYHGSSVDKFIFDHFVEACRNNPYLKKNAFQNS